MLTQARDISQLGSAVGSSTAASASKNVTDPQASQDRFLKLLVAQINNQDPLNPMDNAQMTTQMAQINTVSGIQELNTTLKGMAQQYSAMQAMQGAALIGRQALVDGNQLSFDAAVGRGALALNQPASQVVVDIVGHNGALIDSLDLGARTAGSHAFDWNAAGVDPARVAGFQVRASSGGQPVQALPLMRLAVTAVSLADGAVSLQLQDGRSLLQHQVRAFM
ncbi:flagellar hook capping FlgD N-terminal domain-containing protein [Hydrogenophaga sp.]|uniref:flagellar hook assembly protein FlgD n=1 Tax=Hydrogenophaga sp. TaxID=1904254 RepID=UPI0019875B67|nr:flagellar hook capping FlgD N-terminal domain-containing protein [Hydrogenophaga sp.]MBD3892599.1 flagellar hook assembly protein FlgD [Hydrogenophaga sp.]